MSYNFPFLGAHRLKISGAPTADPGDVVDGSATLVSPGRFSCLTKNAGVVSRLPSAMAVWETPIIGLDGRSTDDATDLDMGDLIQAWLWADSTTSPVDEIIALGFSAGAVNTTNPGCCVALQAQATGRWLVHHGANTGGGWALTAASNDGTTTRGAVLQAVVGTSVASGRINAYSVDSAKTPTTNGQTALGTFSSQANYDRMFVGVGWVLGVAGTPRTVNIGATALVMRGRLMVPSVFPF